MDQEQRQFWDDLLAYYRQELKERQSPAMVSMLTFFHGEEQALEDKRLADSGYVYLLDRGKLSTKHIDQLNPSDAPSLMAELEANQAMAEEHSTVSKRGDVGRCPSSGLPDRRYSGYYRRRGQRYARVSW